MIGAQGFKGKSIQASLLAKSFGSIHALREVNLEVGAGEKVAIFGPNGSGKTTLIKVMATIMRPSSGRLHIAGMNPGENGHDVRRLIGVVSHNTYLYDDLAVEENLAFYGRMYGVENVKARITNGLRRVGLERRSRDRVRTLSRGMQQRLSIARATLHEPPILLLDEPDTGLDEAGQAQLWEMLTSGYADEPTVVMTTHNLKLGMSLCSRWTVLVDGEIVSEVAKENSSSESFQALYRRYAGAGT
ncbi:MAG: ABC transporter ATP-binding protein [Chloroflexi bacterium]|nr:ABC transporter ATP-binding protein [Chloroflexota bacterium]